MALDTDDPRLDGFRRLNEPRYRRRYELANGVFIAEGPTVVGHVLSHAGALVEALLVADRFVDRLPGGLEAPVHVGTQDQLASIVGFDFHRGVLALCRRPAPSTVAHLATFDSLAVMEGVNDHENLGAVIRAAAGLGIEGVLLDPTTADPWYRRSVRVSIGTVVDIPLVRATTWPEPLDTLAAAGLTLIASTPDPAASDVGRLGTVERPAILLGAEGHGLSAEARRRAAVSVRIPMQRDVDSLNVGQAAAVLFHTLTRS